MQHPHYCSALYWKRGPGNHCLRVGGLNSKFVSKTLCILSINLLYPGHPRGWLVSRERNRHHNSRLVRGSLILLRWHQNKCLEASRLASRWEPVSTDRKRLTTLPQYKTWLFNIRESVSKSRREVEAITTKLVASLVHNDKCCVVLLKLLWFVQWHHWQ